ncbi:MAG: 4Fe-4S dicluster domain-containing protein [Clostridiales Family XIII bacterium]|jgi:ferredoxin|nr:4Fe-4S dicluster domain-containing protein [Clostridiales Family XIII bacterium]
MRDKVHANFGVPEAADGIVEIILADRERRLIAALGDRDSFTADEAREALSEDEAPGITDKTASSEFLDTAYRRGVISVAENDAAPSVPTRYAVTDFFARYTIVAVHERGVYLSIPEETRDGIEALYFDRYYDGLDWSRAGGRPTEDIVLTLGESVALLESKAGDGQAIYLTNCDCRSLKNGCGHAKDVCISFEGGTNTWPDRGVSKEITLAGAKEVLARADRDGLVHTESPHGICNCCTDCCYLFRSRERRNSGRVWPAASKAVSVRAEDCIGCGSCVKRCPFGALSFMSSKKVDIDESACMGCGLCVSSCKPNALFLRQLASFAENAGEPDGVKLLARD